jgi:hypothetical protein
VVGSARGSNFRSNLRTWSKMFVSFNLAMGQVVGKLLGQSARSNLVFKSKGFCFGRFMPKPKLKETNQTKATEDTGLVSDPVAGLVSVKCSQLPTVAHGSSPRLELTSAAHSRVFLGLSTSVGGSSYLHLDLAVDSIKSFAYARFVP